MEHKAVLDRLLKYITVMLSGDPNRVLMGHKAALDRLPKYITVMLPGDPNRVLMGHKEVLDRLLKYRCVGRKFIGSKRLLFYFSGERVDTRSKFANVSVLCEPDPLKSYMNPHLTG
jgi:hypothetical protein